MNHKTFSGGHDLLKVDDASGEVTAVFAQLGVKDHDGDVTMPGAFKEGQEVRVSVYNHSSYGSELPAGKGKIGVDGDLAIATMKFFMDTTHGRDSFNTVKGLGGLAEWSYGFDIVKSDMGQVDGDRVQFLKELDVKEVSPVHAGAGIGTHTISVKSLKDMTDEELAQEVEKACKALNSRGLVVPEYVAAMVRETDQKAADQESHQNLLKFLAAVHGINEGAVA